MPRKRKPGPRAFGTDPERLDEIAELMRLRALDRRLDPRKWKIVSGKLVTRRSFGEIAKILNKHPHRVRTWCAKTVADVLKRSERQLSRREALSRHWLEDISEDARAAEIPYDVAVPRRSWQLEVSWRVDGVLGALKESLANQKDTTIYWTFSVLRRANEPPEFHCLRAPGDDDTPVITIMARYDLAAVHFGSKRR